MTTRKYANNTEIICKDNSYNFSKIVIIRKAKSSKKNPEIMYLCAVWLKGNDYAQSWYITEKRLDNIMDGLR